MSLAIRYTFKPYERLKREQHIHTLFLTGKAFSVFPIRLIYLIHPRTDAKLSPALAGFSVPKKKFKHAVQRHRITRLLREAWRLHKHLLYPNIPANSQVHLFFIFTDTQLPPYAQVEKCMQQAIQKLITQIAGQTPKSQPNA